MLIAIESSDRLCAACLYDGEEHAVLASKTIDIGKGHAELLMGLIGDVLDIAHARYADLSAAAVCVGPGSFTGIRVGVAAAIGFGIALKIPVTGVTSLQALAFAAAASAKGRPILSLIDAHRGDVYAQSFDGTGLPLDAPRQIALAEIDVAHNIETKLICGSGAALLQDAYPDLHLHIAENCALPDVDALARASLNPLMVVPAKPLYLRRPDAKPQESYTMARALR
jgi:tRNA threonylcarbamoyladenosine biosynthesis protein TsaB